MALTNPDYLRDLTVAIRDVACECFGDDQPEVASPADCYISHGTPPADCCDYLTVWVERIRPVVDFPSTADVQAKLDCGSGYVGQAADFAIQLMRPCYPSLKDNAHNPFPPPSEIDAAAQTLLVDGWVMWCCLLTAAASGQLIPADTTSECLSVQWRSMEPVYPDGGCTGWTLRFSVELDACC